MVAERTVLPLPGAGGGQMQIQLELPVHSGGPRWVFLRVRRSAPLSVVRDHALDILGTKSLDAYLRVDGRLAIDEPKVNGEVAVAGSRVTMVPRPRGGAQSSEDGSGQPPQLPLAVLPAGLPPTAALGVPFPQMIFDDPMGPRSPAQLSALAETIRAFVDLLARRLEETNERMEAMGVALRGDTEGLRTQAGAVVQNLQEQASSILAQMLADQADAKVQLNTVVSSADLKFRELDGLIAQTRAGLEDVAGHSVRLGAQQAALQEQQAAVERHLRQQQLQQQQPPQQP